MKLTCPDCSTQFTIGADVIGPNGRTVRCSQCSGTWFVASDPDVMDLRERVASQQAQDDFTQGYMEKHENAQPPQIRQKAVLDSSIVGAAALAQTELERQSEQQNIVEDFEVVNAPHAQMRDKRERKKVQRRLAGVAMIWGVTLMILAVATLMMYIMRAQITEKFPVTLKMYQAFGVSVPMAGFEIYGVETRYGDDNGIQTLFVNGKIKNVDVVERDLPLLRLSFKNAAGEILTSWVVQPDQSSLKSDTVLKFTTQYPNPPTGAVHLATNFVDEMVSAPDVPVKVQ